MVATCDFLLVKSFNFGIITRLKFNQKRMEGFLHIPSSGKSGDDGKQSGFSTNAPAQDAAAAAGQLQAENLILQNLGPSAITNQQTPVQKPPPIGESPVTAPILPLSAGQCPYRTDGKCIGTEECLRKMDMWAQTRAMTKFQFSERYGSPKSPKEAHVFFLARKLSQMEDENEDKKLDIYVQKCRACAFHKLLDNWTDDEINNSEEPTWSRLI